MSEQHEMPYADPPAPLSAEETVEERSPIQVADDAFGLLCAGPRPLAVDGTAIGHGLPDRPVPLSELRDALTAPGSATGLSDAAWRVLVTRSRTGGDTWTVGAVGVAVPGLRAIAGRLSRWRGADHDDLDAQVIAGFLRGLRSVDLDRARVWPRLYWAAFGAAAAFRTSEAAQAGVPLPVDGPAAPPAVAGHPDLVLAQAVSAGVISHADARLIGATRLEGMPVKAVARRWRLAVSVVYRRRRRAEAALTEAITTGSLDTTATRRVPRRTGGPDGLSDAQWRAVAPLVLHRYRGSRQQARRLVAAIWWHETTGAAWTDMPAAYGGWRPAYDRHHRWQADGTWTRIQARLHHAESAAGRHSRPASAQRQAA